MALTAYTRKNYRIVQVANNGRVVTRSFWMTKEGAAIVRRRFFGGNSSYQTEERKDNTPQDDEETYLENNFVARGCPVRVKLVDEIMPRDENGHITKLLKTRKDGVVRLCQPIITNENGKPHLLYSAFNTDGELGIYSVVEFEEILQE